MGLIEMASGNSSLAGEWITTKTKSYCFGRSQGLILMMVRISEVGITNILYILIKAHQRKSTCNVSLCGRQTCSLQAYDCSVFYSRTPGCKKDFLKKVEQWGGRGG